MMQNSSRIIRMMTVAAPDETNRNNSNRRPANKPLTSCQSATVDLCSVPCQSATVDLCSVPCQSATVDLCSVPCQSATVDLCSVPCQSATVDLCSVPCQSATVDLCSVPCQSATVDLCSVPCRPKDCSQVPDPSLSVKNCPEQGRASNESSGRFH